MYIKETNIPRAMSKKSYKDIQENVVEVALRLSAEKGWSSLSIADIAYEMDMSRSEMNLYFYDKDDILYALGKFIDSRVMAAELDIDAPVTNIHLKDINECIRWLNTKTGKRYRLPTEAEWEYAARSGSTTAYPWGDNVITFGKEYNGYQRGQANCQICKGEWAGTSTSPVGSFPAYGGLYDMHGNVLEWTCSAYDKNYKDGSELKCATPNDRRPTVLRGGTYDSRIEGIRSASRWYAKPSERSGYYGFRLAR